LRFGAKGEPPRNADLVLNNQHLRLSRAWGPDRKPLKTLYPGKAVILTGLDTLPNPGDIVFYTDKPKVLLRMLNEEYKTQETPVKTEQSKAQSEEDFLDQFFSDEVQTEKERINLIIKFDVEASRRSVLPTIQRFNSEYVDFVVIKSEVGEVTTSDVDLAKDMNAHILAFRVKTSGRITEMAKKSNVNLHKFNTVYELYDYLEQLRLEIESRFMGPEIIGKAKVLKIFELSNKSIVAGSSIIEGKARRGSKARVIREDKEIGTYEIVDLRRFKEKVAEAIKGQECGINLGKNADVKVGDILEILAKTD